MHLFSIAVLCRYYTADCLTIKDGVTVLRCSDSLYSPSSIRLLISEMYRKFHLTTVYSLLDIIIVHLYQELKIHTQIVIQNVLLDYHDTP